MFIILNIAIVEDQQEERLKVASFIQTYAEKFNLSINIEFYSDGIEIIDKYDAKYDIIYLDVEMEYLDGMSAAKKIREYDSEVLLVFITNHSQVAIQGYSVEATDFLLKPLSYFTFSTHFEKIIKKTSLQETSIYLKVGGILQRINLKEILYFESQGHNILVHTTAKTIQITETLRHLETKLDHSFFRCNHSFIVNMNHVHGIEANDIILTNYEKIPVSRSKKKDFLSHLTEFIGDELI
ncbi:LytR/AlgR family response regulator transcription factor [Fundicoccus sp. Sow4_F4]|uniref:LytR/AlgR family response regulator transcription factor n=1 Tax=Fundicoccus sp. Sow4_F4 TaxID=3438783 RepID=UPI003F91724C